MTVRVAATKLLFVQQPTTNTQINTSMTPAVTVEAVDANNIRDLDYVTDVSMTSTGSLSGSPVTATPSSGLATFGTIQHSAVGTGLQLTAASGSLTSALSNPFDIINPLPEINIQSSSFDYFTNSTYSFGNVTSGYYSSAIVFTIQNTGTADLNLTGTPKVVLSGTNASEFIINESMTTTPVTAGSTTTFTITFSPISQGSKSAQISIANNDGTGSENPYIIYLSGTSTVNTVSDIVAKSGYVYPSNIAYASYQAADITGGANDIEIAQFTIRDGGAIADLDNLGTSLNQIVFTVGNSSFIKRIALYDGATEVGTEQPGAGTVTFSGLSLTAADGGTKDFSVRVSFNNTVTDNQQIQLTVAATTSAATTGSTFLALNAGGATTSVSGDDNRIEVTATKLLFVQQPTTNTPINTNMTPAVTVEAVDFNNIRDLDYATLVNITSTGTLTGSPSATPGSGLATFSTLQHSIVGTGLQLTAASGSLTSALSSTFDIISPPIYFNDFGTTLSPPPNENPPSIFASNLSNSLWTTSGVFTNATGGVGNSYCLSVASSSTTSKTFTLTFTVANGYQLDITHFNFWNSRNSNNNSYNNWALSINGTAVGSGSVSYPGGYTGVTAVSSPIAGLTGTITIVYTMSTASSTAYSRLDDFTLYGTVTVLPLPEIDIQGNGNSIVDGDDTPSTSDGSDFGNAVINSGTVDQTYTVNNTGVADLNLTGTTKVVVSGTTASEFTVTAQPGSPVAVGNSTTFTVRFAPTATGLRTATLTIANNDANENPYNFDIQGTGILLPCSGTPSGGTAAATVLSATCIANTDLSLTGQSVESGISLQWQYYDGSTWQDISGGTTNPYTVTGIIATTQYRCNVTCTNSSLSTPSTTVTVTINAPTGGTTAATVNPLCSGSSTTLSLSGATASGVTYIWESSTDGVIYTPIGGATASTYVASPIANTYYHCKLTCTASPQNATSAPLQITMNTTATNVTLLGATVDNLQSLVSWTAPGCYSEVLVVASTGIANTGTPTGDGTAYSANAVFSSGTPLGNGFVVYKGTASSQLVTGLTNGTTYYFKIFTRNGMNWSSGVEVNATPALLSATGIIYAGATGCVTGGSGLWLTNTFWCGAVLPSATTIAQFGALGTNPLLSFNMNGATAAQKTVGAIELLNSNAIDRNLRNSSTTVNGSMTLMGVVVNSTSNVIIRNNSSNLFTITGNNSGNILGLDLGNSTNNIINIDGSGGVTISAIITGTGKALTKAGSGTGVLTLSGANTYSGGTTISSGTLQLGAAGVLADAGTITLSGGTFSTGATTGFTETAGTLNLNASTASTIALGTGDHTLTFANSSSLSPWGAGA
ncbi:MAG TPA: choice-of-anchor D domain-containing protein, partial [Bacteroidales bacterium]|nr:choice-of-anchor D domain-containing protein [Bacteroidales bacterium]